jgi:hypothetical protein
MIFLHNDVYHSIVCYRLQRRGTVLRLSASNINNKK